MASRPKRKRGAQNSPEVKSKSSGLDPQQFQTSKIISPNRHDDQQQGDLTPQDVITQLQEAATQDPSQKARFFKVAPGEYGEHDAFLGVPNPEVQRLAKAVYRTADGTPRFTLAQVRDGFMSSKYNEARLLGLYLLVDEFSNCHKHPPAAAAASTTAPATAAATLTTAVAAGAAANAVSPQQRRDGVVALYLQQIDGAVNNWNLVDASAHKILGPWIHDAGYSHPRMHLLQELVESPVLWRRRTAMVATWHFISKGVFEHTLQLAEKLLGDEQDLMHKAVGWMLREVGKKDQAVLTSFLDKHVSRMPRTMLRYSIERLEPSARKRYLEVPSETLGGSLRGREKARRGLPTEKGTRKS